MSSAVQTVANNPALRKVALSAYRSLARSVFFLPAPRVVLNSVPKAGTHLLSAVVSRFPRMMFSGVHHALNEFSLSPSAPPEVIPEVDLDRIERALASIRKGQFITAHFPHTPNLEGLFARLDFVSVLMVRDPRDISVSHAFYSTGLERHFLHRRFTEALRAPEERIMAIIRGFPADEYGPGQESIGRRMQKYLGWVDSKSVLAIRFEDLVGSAGGGSDEAQERAIDAIARHVGRPLDAARVERVRSNVWSSKSVTFRKGAIGDWRNHFTDEHVAAFDEVAGDVMGRLGYANDGRGQA